MVAKMWSPQVFVEKIGNQGARKFAFLAVVLKHFQAVNILIPRLLWAPSYASICTNRDIGI